MYFPQIDFYWQLAQLPICKITSTSFNPLVNKVLPLLTRSQMASAKPMPGAISTEPLISCISALLSFSFK